MTAFFVFISAVFLRFYRLADFITFLSDQGRDAIIIKRIVALEHFPAIGASSSVGQVYLGPFYYYLISPFLLLFNFNPVGLAFAVALLSIIGIFIVYLITKKEFNKKVALFFLLFIAFSYTNITASRFSWNPNLLPFFSFLTLYFFNKVLTSNRIKYSVLFGAFLSFSIQLHYLATFLIFPVIIFVFLNFLKNYKNKKFLSSQPVLKRIYSASGLLNYLISFISFIFFSFPLIIFDLRHNFLNAKNFFKLVSQEKIVSNSSFLTRLGETAGAFIKNITINQTPIQITFLIFFGLFILFIFLRKNKNDLFLSINFVNLFTYLVAFSFLSSARHAHYYHPVYLSFFLVLSYLFFLLISKKSILYKLIIFIFFISYTALNIKNCYFLYGKATNQIQHAQNIANFLAKKIQNKPFNIATWPVDFFEDQYLYFLELKGIIPADRTRREITQQMFVLCAKEPCQIINSPSWNISMFGRAKIDKIWTIDGIKIYKLIHENNPNHSLL